MLYILSRITMMFRNLRKNFHHRLILQKPRSSDVIRLKINDDVFVICDAFVINRSIILIIIM